MNDKKDFSAEKVREIINTNFIGREIHFYEKVTSTFDIAKEIEKKDGTVIIAKEQTAGKGRLGRSWESLKGGLYFSVILSTKYFMPHLQFATVLCALAVQKSIGEITDCYIKWPNDIVSKEGKKLCGILSKTEFSDGKAEFINVGIGINANNSCFSKELKFASSIKNITGEKVNENKLLCRVFENLEALLFEDKKKITGEFSKVCITVGSRVKAIYPDGRKEIGVCTEVTSDGSIVILKDNSEAVCVNSGEVSVRGIYGESYV